MITFYSLKNDYRAYISKTDRQTDQPTDIAASRVAFTQLKIKNSLRDTELRAARNSREPRLSSKKVVSYKKKKV